MFNEARLKQIKSANEEKVRHGKTEKDAKSHAAKRRRDNQEQRHNWINENRGKTGIPTTFPDHTCGGKGTSSRAFKVIAGRGRSQKYKKK